MTLSIVSGLVEADHHVEKIDIKYETVAKRVDVKKLKQNIWQELSQADPPNNAQSSEIHPDATPDNAEPGQAHGKETEVEAAADSELHEPSSFEQVVSQLSDKVGAQRFRCSSTKTRL